MRLSENLFQPRTETLPEVEQDLKLSGMMALLSQRWWCFNERQPSINFDESIMRMSITYRVLNCCDVLGFSFVGGVFHAMFLMQASQYRWVGAAYSFVTPPLEEVTWVTFGAYYFIGFLIKDLCSSIHALIDLQLQYGFWAELGSASISRSLLRTADNRYSCKMKNCSAI